MWNTLLTYLTPQPPSPGVPLSTKLLGSRVTLRMGDPTDWKEWRHIREASREFLTPWEPLWPENALSYNFFCGLLRRHWRDWRQGRAYAFLVDVEEPKAGFGSLAGGIALNDVQRGIAQKATLGYWMGLPYAQQGLMMEAAELLCDFAANTLRLHRLEASCLPNNERSKKLLRRLGFEEEGYAKAYLQINGVWQDHILYGKMLQRSHL